MITNLIRAVALFMFASTGLASTHHPLSESIVPAPELSPRDVVQYQLDALRHNDEQDRGIALTYRFAAPSNKAQTGPLPRFARMIKNGPYALMLNFRDAIYSKVTVDGNQAYLSVVLIGETQTVRYEFMLSKQQDGPNQNCWMTEAVSARPFNGNLA